MTTTQTHNPWPDPTQLPDAQDELGFGSHPATRTVTVEVQDLRAGQRFVVDSFPEGRIFGEFTMRIDHRFVEVYIDGDDGLSCWPVDTPVEPILI